MLATETALAQLRGGAEWLQRQLDEFKARLDGLQTATAGAEDAIATEVARRERLSKDLDFIRSDLIYHRGQARDLIEALRGADGRGHRADGLQTAGGTPLPGALPHPQGPAATTASAGQPADPQAVTPSSSSSPKTVATEASPAPVGLTVDDRLDAYYVAFEEEFRGSPEQIRETQVGYIADLHAAQVVTADSPVLDLGCGRGEWLALLAEHGLSARGVDTNSVMVARCREQGLVAQQADALAVLQALPDAALGAVTAFHLIEHLPFELLHALLEQAHRALCPGGVLILETPNPENVLVGSHTFYHDPTHRNPMTPTATRFLVRYLGFTDPEIRRLHPYPEQAKVPGTDPLTERVNGHLCGPQDFAVIARKPWPQPKAEPNSQPADALPKEAPGGPAGCAPDASAAAQPTFETSTASAPITALDEAEPSHS
ncbi:MAG: methyltransferase domain-containing protein [Gammaproteobacteria bacterium]|jgi:SAM-dependent methyltransferase|nr:methyltransferase domain-containing protein [Gammaproteobacteria bacterium]